MRLTALFIVLAVLASPGLAQSLTLSGRVGASFYNRDDDVPAHDFSITRLRLRLDAADFAGDRVDFNFTGSTRMVGGKDFNSEAPDSRVETAKINVNRLLGRIDVSLGRDYLGELGGARVDGANIKLRLSGQFGIGVFGGFAPDPYEDVFNADYTVWGAYLFSRGTSFGASGGYTTSMYRGAEDMTYAYASAYYAMSRALRFSASGRSDRDMDNGGFDLTNLLLTVDWSPSRLFRSHLSYNQYRAVRLFESMDYDPGHELQESVRLHAVLNPFGSTSIYVRADARRRETDGKTAALYMAGVRQSGIFRWFFADVSYRKIDYFTSRLYQVSGAAGVNAGDDVSVELSAVYMTGEHDGSTGGLAQWIYGAGLNWMVTRRLYLGGRAEYSSEKYPDVESIYLAGAADEFTAVSFHLHAGYRF